RGPDAMIGGYSGYGRQAGVPGYAVRTAFSVLTYERFRRQTTALTDLFAFARAPRVNLAADRQADAASFLAVAGNYFTAIGVPPLLGRVLTPADDRPGSDPAVAISHIDWQRRVAADPDIVGNRVGRSRVPAVHGGGAPEG